MTLSKYSFLDFAEDVLSSAPAPLIYQEIWDIGKDQPFRKKLNDRGRTPWASLGARLFVDVRDNPESKFIKVGKNPARFFLKNRQNELSDRISEDLNRAETVVPKIKTTLPYLEKDLHPVLAYFAYANAKFNKGKAIYTKTILHGKSRKTGYNEWVHPDMVGFYIPIEDWNGKLLELNNVSDCNSIKMYSFELKRRVDKSNYREYFFQAVSNSTWANEGYLVASEFKQDDDLFSELERLSTSFGIGIIRLDLEDIDASEVLYSARAKSSLDWELMNKLCEQNADFEKFIDDVTKDFKVKTIHKEQYDRVPGDIEGYIEGIMGG